ncbi:hypothetical protein GmHk_13G038881 [Glycine max]|nr:hypothetical protein GmHk_13G038881 [Glycine max]
MIKSKCQQEKAFGKLQYCMGVVSGDHTREGVGQGLKSIQEKRGSGVLNIEVKQRIFGTT